MEIVSPLSFTTVYLLAPFAPNAEPPPLNHPSTLLATLFVIHYINRALISPLRSPDRSKSHIAVVFAAVIFNLVNPPLMAAFLSAPGGYPHPLRRKPATSIPASPLAGLIQNLQDKVAARVALSRTLGDALTDPIFLLGIFMFLVGFVSNIFHDEILYDLRRSHPPTADGEPHYAIPYGGLYKYISYPNYLCEWVEFVGFAIAASPHWDYTPPWMFVVAEIMVMAPRAYKGHQWYHQKFPEYPKDRKAVIPFVY
ncbi:hypothetical protein FRC19_002142 [Serendipita sp. 401]|nr:hypothetical protein FRC19_002142 [Serendipita sp. 401]KAG8834590.1 hypothetical protein FRC18_001791 [Serendipita sp. 400]